MAISISNLPPVCGDDRLVPVKTQLSEWTFAVPPSNMADKTLCVLTIMGIAVPGVWQGKAGEHFSAWCELQET
jgi:hypothetical protein